MASRVARVVVASAALGGLAAASVAVLAVDQLVSNQADQRLRAATVTLAGELDEDLEEKKGESVARTVDDENSEIVTSGIRLAVFEGPRQLAGDDWIVAPAPETCETRRIARGRVRSCALAHRSWVLVAAQPVDEAALYWWYALAALGAVLLGAVVGAVSSVALSRWAAAPLEALSRALRASRPEAPGALELGPPEDCEEVEAIRSALADLTARLQAVLDQAHRFAGDAAHELRTPLTALRAELELLAEQSTGPDREALSAACGRAARLSELVDRLLILALPSENLHAGFETVAVADVIEQVIAELPPAQRERVECTIEGEGLVRGDPRLLASLVSNAVQNALKFAPEGSIGVRLEETDAESAEPARSVTILVTDEGPGVPSELRARVFEPFYRVRSRATPGYGLGLALVGHIARAHGGRAEFDDRERGAQLRVTLPAWRAEPAQARERS